MEKKEFACLLPIEWAARFDWKSTSEGPPSAVRRLPSPFSVREAEEDQEETQVNGNASHIFTSIVGAFLRGSQGYECERALDISTSHLREIPRPA